MTKKFVFPMSLLIFCAFFLLVACGKALSQVFLELRAPLLFRGI